ncbi:hypothetical protein Tco_0725124 [Tanacetum coccineum]|uniref:Uncharacterized protein n=1 Tax=Tanacetum coccineum TaxID=301880 RepID=A0ABQ4YE55_9ASTR
MLLTTPQNKTPYELKTGTQDNMMQGHSEMEAEPAQNTMYCHSEVFLKLQQSEAEAKNEMNKPNGDTGPKQMRSPKVSVSDQALLE